MRSNQGIVQYIYREKDIIKLETKLKQFGVSRKWSTASFLNIQFFTSLLLFFIVFLFASNGFILAPILTVMYYFGFMYFIVDRPLKKRARKLEHEAFYFFEVLTLALESGRNLEMGIDAACTHIESEIASEFNQTLCEIKFGKSLAEALDEMRFRIPSETVNNIILNVAQSSLFGNSILETMYNQLDFLREKQVMEVKAEISKIPTKISIFSVVFFVPLILLLILAPLVIDYISNL
jgi:tight adherence protein C